MLKQYFNSFFDNEAQRIIFNSICSDNYQNNEISEWLSVENRFKKTLPYSDGLDSFYIELNKSASIFIKELFFKYVDITTFVIGAAEHTTIRSCMDNIQNKLYLDWNIIKKYDIDTIINQFKQSNCKKIFIYGTGILNSQVVPQSFYIKLKERLSEENIEHVIVLDDVQGMFVVPRDYSIFDNVIFTCHALVPNFDLGILLSKTHEALGYTDAKKLNMFLDLLDLLFKRKDKLLLFNFMLKQYLAEELMETELFYIPEYSTLNVFSVILKNEKMKNILIKYKDSLSEESIIEIEDVSITVRASFMLRFNTEQILEELKKLKEILQKCIKLNNRWQQ